MRFLIDECVSPTTVHLLRNLGHDVVERYEPRLKHLLTTTHLDKLTNALILLEEKRHRIIGQQPH